MNKKERTVIVIILLAVALMVLADLLTDSKEGTAGWHMVIEGLVGLGALYGIFFVLKGSVELQHQLTDTLAANSQLRQEAEQWKTEAQKYIEGLSQSIDGQLTKWNLSHSEKEVALLLLKGLSLKEIADVRSTTEKTARVQSMAVYSKSGLSGRSELAAFFLEDLLQPQPFMAKS